MSSVSEISKLFPAMKLEDASVKLKRKKCWRRRKKKRVEQCSWKNFIGVSNTSAWIDVDKRSSRTGGERRMGVDRRRSQVGVEKRRGVKTRRILDKWFTAIIRYPRPRAGDVYGNGRHGWALIGHRRKRLWFTIEKLLTVTAPKLSLISPIFSSRIRCLQRPSQQQQQQQQQNKN
ncbi:hypothetical protein HanXRQr2_Chr05g0233671 [Helianthus annuus]|uniref:Uncharacterized protein n=1 Tax=Helianthus annuus TaxID=4232 RepID=A0A9K3J2J2_HELAN|nr:hypothetical protein HanXRQr2_Chr05g0233671 [Helianthus annuus]